MKSTLNAFRGNGGLRCIDEKRPDDVFLVCASYEERTVAVAESLSDDYRCRRGLVYLHRELLENRSKDKFQANITRLHEVLGRHCDRVDEVRGSWLHPRDHFLPLRDALARGAPGLERDAPLITADITTFNRETLLTMMAVIRTQHPDARIRVTYVSPRDHGEWLSRGFRCVRSVIGFPGIQDPARAALLAVLSGFEPERTQKIIEQHEPTRVLLGIGDPPTSMRFLERNVAEQRLILARQEVTEFRFSADDIEKCLGSLERLVGPYVLSHNVTLAPMCTKLSTIAAFLFAERHPEVQVTYCVPGEYNVDDYSSGADSIFVADIPHY